MTAKEFVCTENERNRILADVSVIDPAKVVRTALQNAASVASLRLTTECLIATRPSDDAGDGDDASGGMGCRPDSIEMRLEVHRFDGLGPVFRSAAQRYLRRE